MPIDKNGLLNVRNWKRLKARIFKPIIGCEMYVARRWMEKGRKTRPGGYHLVVLGNKVGYHNLIKLVSRAWTEGYYMRPRVPTGAELEKYHEGLIVSTACLGGEVPKKITQGLYEDEEANQVVQEFVW